MSKIDPVNIKKSSDYLRYLALECIQQANSGHPGLPLGCAEIGTMLYRYILKFNPEAPQWANRDRFVLSAGHGSMLLYPLLYSAGYPITLEDMGQFRQLHGKTPGHPEYELKDGIETTTGPLGQGFANAVGMAIEGKMLAQRFNEKDFNLFDYNVYVLMGDGCNMEGISYEAGSMAGHLGLDNLIAIYDSNRITIDGETNITFTEDVAGRYRALGWDVIKANISGLQDVFDKLQGLKELKGKPKMLILTTTIGEGLSENKKGKSGIHGAPAGADEIAFFIQNSTARALFEEKYGKDAVADTARLKEIVGQRVSEREPLLPLESHLEFMRADAAQRREATDAWEKLLGAYRTAFPEKYKEYNQFAGYKLPEALDKALLNYSEDKADATRGISGRVLNLCAAELPQIVGGCADLVGSTKAAVKGSDYVKAGDFSGRNIAFGVREHAMGAIGNGLALNQQFIPFTSTFFTFFDYMKPAVRLSALMKLNHLYIFSHDSIYVGEDGPTHQPIEHLNSLRLLPGMRTFRPANDVETAFAYLYFLRSMNGPIALVTSRQKVAHGLLDESMDREALYENFAKGAYILYETETDTEPELILCASGSEVSLALEAGKLVEEREDKRVRVISIPCPELLDDTDIFYREELFNDHKTPLVVIEAASHRGVHLFYGPKTVLIDIQSFGESAPGGQVGEYFGFTAEAVCKRISEQIG